jgi:hypothetical protein
MEIAQSSVFAVKPDWRIFTHLWQNFQRQQGRSNGCHGHLTPYALAARCAAHMLRGFGGRATAGVLTEGNDAEINRGLDSTTVV